MISASRSSTSSTSLAGNAGRLRPPRWLDRAGNRAPTVNPAALTTSFVEHPAKQCTRTRSPAISLTAKLGCLSGWLGHRAIHLSGPVRRTSSSRFSSWSAITLAPPRREAALLQTAIAQSVRAGATDERSRESERVPCSAYASDVFSWGQ